MDCVSACIQNVPFEEISKVFVPLGVDVKECKTESLRTVYLLSAQHDDEENEWSPVQMECNGLILEKDTNRVVASCQPKFFDNVPEEQLELLCSVSSKVSIEYCEDGTVVRLYNYNGRWYTATARCIDARRSHWSSDRTFDDMFWEVFPREAVDTLQPEYTYVFILLHNENRIVVKHSKNMVVYVCNIHNAKQTVDAQSMPFSGIHTVRRPVQINDKPLDVNGLLANYYTPLKRGILIKCSKDNGESVTLKYDFPLYHVTKTIRGNTPCIAKRYIQLQRSEDEQRVLTTQYAEHADKFAAMDRRLRELCATIHQLYIDSHVKKTIRIDDTHPMLRTLKQLHATYKTSGRPIMLADVTNKVGELPPHVLLRLIQTHGRGSKLNC